LKRISASTPTSKGILGINPKVISSNKIVRTPSTVYPILGAIFNVFYLTAA